MTAVTSAPLDGVGSAKVVTFPDGVAINGEFPSPAVMGKIIMSCPSELPLVICDPPYGNIVSEAWDRPDGDDRAFARWMVEWTKAIESISAPGAALYVFGGIGTPRDGSKAPFRPFYRYLVDVEHETGFRLSTPVTWKKKRGYGIQWRYLFAREEIGYFVLGDVKSPRKFNVPFLERERGYAGYNKKYPAKSPHLRRTNVWDDITEILRGKTHVAQKPVPLMKIPIEVHTDRGEWVLDPFAGSGTTARASRELDRRWVLVERDPLQFERLVESLR